MAQRQLWHKWRFYNLETEQFVEDVCQIDPDGRWVRRRVRDGDTYRSETVHGRFLIERMGRRELRRRGLLSKLPAIVPFILPLVACAHREFRACEIPVAPHMPDACSGGASHETSAEEEILREMRWQQRLLELEQRRQWRAKHLWGDD
jgi:hypothetical protein